MRIMCVDDDPVWLGLLKEMLREVCGAETRVVTSLTGYQALRLADRTSYDLAIVDLKLCDMSGFDVIKQLRAEHPALHLVALTGWNDLSTVAQSRSAGAAYCLFKPLSIQVLSDMLKVIGMVESETVAAEPAVAVG